MGRKLKLLVVVLLIIVFLIFGFLILKKIYQGKTITEPSTQPYPKETSATLDYIKRYDVYDKDKQTFVKKIVAFSIKNNPDIIVDAHYYVDPLLDSLPPEQYSYYEIRTITPGCILSTRGGYKIPENESWELVFKQKLGEIKYFMESTGNKGNISGTITDSLGLKIPISFGVSWEDNKLMDSCINDGKSILSLLDYEIEQ